jgi:hypothetical protein
MKLRGFSFCFFCVLCASALNAFSLDREAFTFTNYDLNVRVEPEQQRLAVRGKITLRNDSPTPQKIAVLQISSSLDWRSIHAGDKALQYVSQPYTSDIDHTGALSEAIVTLPEAVAPQGAIELEIAYEGVIPLDGTRLTRIGTPEAVAASTDWDQIGVKFTAVRGVGYVAWYPIATEVADLSEGSNLFEVLGRWKAREAASTMELHFDSPTASGDAAPPIVLCGGSEQPAMRGGSPKFPWSHCSYQPIGFLVPAFVMASYGAVDRPAITVYNLPTHAAAAETYAEAAEKVVPFITEWFGTLHEKATTADLANPDAAPFESGVLLLTPLTVKDSQLAALQSAHQLTHSAFFSPRPWINEGLGHFAQTLYLEQQKGRQAALDYMGLHRSGISGAEPSTTLPRSEDEVSRSLVNTANEELYRSKAMYVWWMLRDMIGDPALKKALAAYKPEQDREPSYMPKLIQAQTQRDLEWFFDDWVYRDRGLPDFKVASAFSRKTMTDVYILTVTVDNLGAAGADVPVTVKHAGGVVTKRIEMRGKSKAVIRVEVSGAPQEVIVNDGSVPETDMANNTFQIESSKIGTSGTVK